VAQGQAGLLKLSGTSMAAAVASGAAALVLEANPGLTPEQVRMTLQLTSTFLPDAGLVGAGAGSLNIPAALQVAANGPGLAPAAVTIGGELAEASGLTFGQIEPERGARG
jgi:serine protease AprX